MQPTDALGSLEHPHTALAGALHSAHAALPVPGTAAGATGTRELGGAATAMWAQEQPGRAYGHTQSSWTNHGNTGEAPPWVDPALVAHGRTWNPPPPPPLSHHAVHSHPAPPQPPHPHPQPQCSSFAAHPLWNATLNGSALWHGETAVPQNDWAVALSAPPGTVPPSQSLPSPAMSSHQTPSLPPLPLPPNLPNPPLPAYSSAPYSGLSHPPHSAPAYSSYESTRSAVYQSIPENSLPTSWDRVDPRTSGAPAWPTGPGPPPARPSPAPPTAVVSAPPTTTAFTNLPWPSATGSGSGSGGIVGEYPVASTSASVYPLEAPPADAFASTVAATATATTSSSSKKGKSRSRRSSKKSDSRPSPDEASPSTTAEASTPVTTTMTSLIDDEDDFYPLAPTTDANGKQKKPRRKRRKMGEPPRDLAQRKYVCELCVDQPKSFARPSALKIHMLTHTKEKPHVCPVCFRSFAIISNLKRHQKLHKDDGGDDPLTQQDDLAG
ncbi:hypothetical protein JCM8097_005465 [Rhodosporidiobolus ruineniae]